MTIKRRFLLIASILMSFHFHLLKADVQSIEVKETNSTSYSSSDEDYYDDIGDDEESFGNTTDQNKTCIYGGKKKLGNKCELFLSENHKIY
ncbi:CLUMA_CG016338, isoform A [Clunio marinus]|uniref:CLUMA_CG016338, isoform A n=1 Tax=Clunio marinus TaxID=568069 RepID=A0A1J1IYR5_9DIPT|nr:CLUMA_CG016338, isoform A [Clunio marinus]